MAVAVVGAKTAPSSYLFDEGVTPDAVFSLFDNCTKLSKDLQKIVLSYFFNFFGPEEWEKFRGIKVDGTGATLANHDVTFLLGPDPIEPHLPAWKTHVIVLGPKTFTVTGADQTWPRTLNTLKLGNAGVVYVLESESLKQNGDKQAGETHLIIQRIPLHSIDKPMEHQQEINIRSGYKKLPSAIDVVTVQSCVRAWKDVCLLCDEKGREVYTRTGDKVKYSRSVTVTIGASLEYGVYIDFIFADIGIRNIGMVGQR